MKNSVVTLVATVLLAFSAASVAGDKEDLQKLLTAHDALSCTFEQMVIGKGGSKLSSSKGKLYLKKPDSLMMHTTEPDEQVLYTKGKEVHFYDPLVNQVSIFNKKDLYTSPFMLLNSTDPKIWDNYSVSRTGDVYTLTPKSKAEISSLSITFYGNDVKEIAIAMKDGNLNSYSLSDIVYKASAGDFEYKLPDDVQVDDESR
ncbi:MAG: outer membrane lipoprotein chaperone LolA [Succinivibrio sp.]